MRWNERYEQLLNWQQILPAEEDLSISFEAPTMKDSKQATITCNNGKVTIPDGIPAEAIKATLGVSMEVSHPLF